MSKKFITQFTRSTDSVRKTNVVKFTQPSKVVKSLSYATSIKSIYDNYCHSGNLPLNGNKPIYDDNFIKYDNLIEAQQAVKEASSYFANLPADVRQNYGNKLENFVNAIHSQDDFLVKSGVLKLTPKENPEVITPETVVTPTVQPVQPQQTTQTVNTATTDVL